MLNIFPMSTDYIIKNLLNAVPSQKLVCNNIYNDQLALLWKRKTSMHQPIQLQAVFSPLPFYQSTPMCAHESRHSRSCPRETCAKFPTWNTRPTNIRELDRLPRGQPRIISTNYTTAQLGLSGRVARPSTRLWIPWVYVGTKTDRRRISWQTVKGCCSLFYP